MAGNVAASGVLARRRQFSRAGGHPGDWQRTLHPHQARHHHAATNRSAVAWQIRGRCESINVLKKLSLVMPSLGGWLLVIFPIEETSDPKNSLKY